MREISLNEQAVDFLKEMLELALNGDAYSETSKGIMRHILEKLNK
jgi:hypothetical protein